MKTESTVKPKKYDIEERENGNVAVIFFENIVEKDKIVKKNKDEQKNYQYDRYVLETKKQDNLDERIDSNYDTWLEFAKNQEIEKLSTEIRKKRDALLAESDWTQMTDTALSKKKQDEYKTYRQALRDITEQEGFPYTVEFPTLESEE